MQKKEALPREQGKGSKNEIKKDTTIFIRTLITVLQTMENLPDVRYALGVGKAVVVTHNRAGGVTGAPGLSIGSRHWAGAPAEAAGGGRSAFQARGPTLPRPLTSSARARRRKL